MMFNEWWTMVDGISKVISNPTSVGEKSVYSPEPRFLLFSIVEMTIKIEA